MTVQARQETQTLPATLVVGLGVTGLSVLRFLRRRGVPVAVTDSRAEPPGREALEAEFGDLPAALGGFEPEWFEHARTLIVSPGVPVGEPLIRAARARGAEVIGDIELFAREAKAPVVAITGSNGKSTVTTLVSEMASDAGRAVRTGGNIGRPALELLTDSEPDLYVLELSSFQLETTASLDAAAAVVLNISPDHMDRYNGLADYAAAKQRVYRGHGVMVVNCDQPAVLAMQAPGRPTVGFGLGRPLGNDFGLLQREGEDWLAHGEQPLMPVRELRMAGRHNQANALAALALGEAVGLPMESMLATLRRFAGLWHRTQWVAEIDGVRWYNDSKATNVGATLAAIEGLEGPLVLILGGQGKGADFLPLREPLSRKARAVVLMGEAAEDIAHVLDGVVPVRRAADMDEAVAQARALAEPGDAVLLSPACASFDMFDGFAARGDAFIRAVRALDEREAQP